MRRLLHGTQRHGDVRPGLRDAGALDQLEGFASFHGPDFYGLPRNTGRITLARQAWTLPETLPFGDADIKPLCGGETLAWRMQA